MALGGSGRGNLDAVLSQEPLELRYTSQKIVNAISAELSSSAPGSRAGSKAMV